MESRNWQTVCSDMLLSSASKCFAAWLLTRAGKAWIAKGRKGSPYAAGYSRPDWHDDLISAMNRGDESDAKGIRLANL